MSKKTKKDIERRIVGEQSLKAKKLLLNPYYEKDLEALGKTKNKLDSVRTRLDKVKSISTATNHKAYNTLLDECEKLRKEYEEKETAFCEKYDIGFPYPLEVTKWWENEKAVFPGYWQDKAVSVIHLIPNKNKEHTGSLVDEYLRKQQYEDLLNEKEKGYIHITVNPKATKQVIHYLIDNILDKSPAYQTKNGNRFRTEQNKALEVWEERRLRKPFKQIARKLNIKEPACKKMFYKAYELLYSKKYNPADYKKPEIKKEYLKRACKTCKERPTCKDLCPDVIAFVEQDNKTYQREPTFKYI